MKTQEFLTSPSCALAVKTALLWQDRAYLSHLSLLSPINLPIPNNQPLGKGLMGWQSHFLVLGLNKDPSCAAPCDQSM